MRKPRYRFLSKMEEEATDFVTPELPIGLLESGDVATFNTIIGVIQDLEERSRRVSDDQEKCLPVTIGALQSVTSTVPQVIEATIIE